MKRVSDWTRRHNPGRDSLIMKVRAAKMNPGGAANSAPAKALTPEQEEEMLLNASYNETSSKEAEMLSEINKMGRKPGDEGTKRATAPPVVFNVPEMDDMQLTETEVQQRYNAMGYTNKTGSSMYMLDHEQVNTTSRLCRHTRDLICSYAPPHTHTSYSADRQTPHLRTHTHTPRTLPNARIHFDARRRFIMKPKRIAVFD